MLLCMQVLNKKDLVSKAQLSAMLDQIRVLNPKAKIVTSERSKIDVMDILDTRLFKSEDLVGTFVMDALKAEATEVIEDKNCCLKSLAKVYPHHTKTNGSCCLRIVV